MSKVVYNACYGGFSLSKKAALRLLELGVKGMKSIIREGDRSGVRLLMESYNIPNKLPRHDKRLVQVVEEIGADASGTCAELKVAKITGNKYIIDEYDGFESVQTPEDINWITIK
jgi:hypothetical protein